MTKHTKKLSQDLWMRRAQLKTRKIIANELDMIENHGQLGITYVDEVFDSIVLIRYMLKHRVSQDDSYSFIDLWDKYTKDFVFSMDDNPLFMYQQINPGRWAIMMNDEHTHYVNVVCSYLMK